MTVILLHAVCVKGLLKAMLLQSIYVQVPSLRRCIGSAPGGCAVAENPASHSEAEAVFICLRRSARFRKGQISELDNLSLDSAWRGFPEAGFHRPCQQVSVV